MSACRGKADSLCSHSYFECDAKRTSSHLPCGTTVFGTFETCEPALKLSRD